MDGEDGEEPGAGSGEEINRWFAAYIVLHALISNGVGYGGVGLLREP